jgi:hypothetical protein
MPLIFYMHGDGMYSVSFRNEGKFEKLRLAALLNRRNVYVY